MAVITVAGSLNMDLVIRAPRRPQSGETVLGGAFGMTGGGKGSNQALAIARLNAKPYLVGYVGGDDFGRRLSGVLRDSGVDCTHLHTKTGVMTGVAVIVVTDRGESAIILSQGANALFDEAALEQARDVFKASDAALFQMEIPAQTVAAGLKLAKESGCKTFLSADPPFPLPDSAWPWIDYLILNEKGLRIYTSGDTTQQDTAPSEPDSGRDTELEIREMAAVLQARGVRDVVVTRGVLGGMYFTGKRYFSFEPFTVHAVDNTGARDAFCAALCTGLSEGMSVEKAARFASAAGALTCTRFGAHTSLPWRHEIENLLAKTSDE